jgi:large subunit ribosomal protein L1
MPNPKMGSVTTDVTKAIRNARIGTVQFRVDREGVMHAGIGKKSFSTSKLLDNIRAFMMSLSDAKPEGLKGKYILKAVISSSMGPGVVLDTPSVDPSNAKFMLEASKLGGAARK